MLTRAARLFAAIFLIATWASVLRAQSAPATSPAGAPPKSIIVTATLEAFESTDLYAKDGGYVTQVQADMGDHVKTGQILAVIDDPELQKQIDSAQAALAARQALAKAAEAALEQANKTRDVVSAQRAGYEADFALAQATLKRQEELFAGKAITNQQLDEFRAKEQVASAQAQVAGAKVVAADADIAAAQASIVVAKSQVEVAQAEIQRLMTLQQYTKITAPFDGVITRRMVNHGDLVQSGATNRATPLFTCQRLDTIRVFCDVPEASSAAITAGTQASVKIFGLNNLVTSATVTRIAYSLDTSTRTMRAEIDLPNPGEKLRPGMYAQVTLTPSDSPRAADPSKAP